MNTIIQVINSINGQIAVLKRKLKVALVVDVSGSTSTQYKQGINVLEKELSALMQFVLENPDNQYVLYSFDSKSYYHGELKVLVDEGFVDLPQMVPGASTYTHFPLAEIASKLQFFKPDFVKVFTDGATNSSVNDFAPILREFKKNGVALQFVAVSPSNLNMEQINAREEARIPGMDVVNMIKNDVASLEVYNLVHDEVSFKGAVSSAVDKHAIKFMSQHVNDPIPVFINKLLDAINANKETLNWGPMQADLKKTICEIGKLFSLLYVDLDQYFVADVIQRICTIIPEITPDRVGKLMNYGFDCTKNEKPIIYTNIDEHVKDAAVKQNQFGDAVALLTAKGTTLGQQTYISLPTRGVCVIADKSFPLSGYVGAYRSSSDAYGNPYFGINGHPQAHRIGAREVLKTIGFPDAQRCPDAIFYVADQMARMHIKGVSMDSEHMKELRKIAVNQASMEVMVAQGKYDGIGCYANWKLGRLIPMHFSKKATHIDLYTNSSINPLNLPQTIWWALMMSMFGIFTEQLKSYEGAVTAFCAESGMEMSEENFLLSIRAKYSGSLTGNPVLLKLEPTQTSFFTLDEFPAGAQLFRLKDHGQCRVRALYSGGAAAAAAVGASEVDYVNQNGCLFCKHKPRASEWEAVVVEDNATKLANAMRQAVPLTVRLGAAVPIGMNPVAAPAAASAVVASVLQAPAVAAAMAQMNNLSNDRLLYALMGVTGSGKTTAREKLERQLIAKGYKVLVASADDIAKLGHKDAGQQVTQKIQAFTATREKHAIILDICHERGFDKSKVFGRNLSSYKDVIFVPNFDKTQDDFKDYECFCLNNVLARPMHSADTNFWLNPASATVKVCIEVHNTKAAGIMRTLGVAGKNTGFNIKSSTMEIQCLIRDGAARHTAKLAARPSLDEQLAALLTSNGL